MIKVDKEMQWDDVRDIYGGQVLFMNVLSEKEGKFGIEPDRVFIYWVIECLDDKVAANNALRNGVVGNKYMVPVSDSVRYEHPELEIYHNY